MVITIIHLLINLVFYIKKYPLFSLRILTFNLIWFYLFLFIIIPVFNPFSFYLVSFIFFNISLSFYYYSTRFIYLCYTVKVVALQPSKILLKSIPEKSVSHPKFYKKKCQYSNTRIKFFVVKFFCSKKIQPLKTYSWKKSTS